MPKFRSQTPKIRPTIRIKTWTTKRGGRCPSCRLRYEKGDQVTVVNVRRRTYHPGCVPANAATVVPGTAGAGMGTVGTAPPVGTTAEAVVKAIADPMGGARWSPIEAKLVSLQALETTLMLVSKKLNYPPELDKVYETYLKLKGHCIRPANDNENRQAFLVAVRKLVDAVFGASL